MYRVVIYFFIYSYSQSQITEAQACASTITILAFNQKAILNFTALGTPSVKWRSGFIRNTLNKLQKARNIPESSEHQKDLGNLQAVYKQAGGDSYRWKEREQITFTKWQQISTKKSDMVFPHLKRNNRNIPAVLSKMLVSWSPDKCSHHECTFWVLGSIIISKAQMLTYQLYGNLNLQTRGDCGKKKKVFFVLVLAFTNALKKKKH